MDFVKSEDEMDLGGTIVQFKTENDSSEEEMEDLIEADVSIGFQQVLPPLKSFSHCTNNRSSDEESDPQNKLCIVKIEEETVQFNEVTPYTCKMCNCTYDGLASYEVHFEKKHGHSEKGAKQRKMHNIALQTDQKPYKCDECTSTFTTPHKLKIHKRIHTGEKPYKCDECTSGFNQNGHLKSHKMMHTGERPYKCDECTSCFTVERGLRLHKMAHAGERPYKCDECTSCFTDKSGLKKHKMIHTGEKPYRCDECTSSYITISVLRRHKKIHTGEKPYECDECTSCFTVKSSLKKHKMIHKRV